MRKTHLYALRPDGRQHLATREKTSDTFHEQCRQWVQKHGCPLLVIIDADETYPEHVKVFYPRNAAQRNAWQKTIALSGQRICPADECDTVWTREEYDEHQRKLKAQAMHPTPKGREIKPPGFNPQITMPASAVPKRVLPDCQCNAEIEPYFRTYSNGTKHVYLACVQCLKITATAVKKSLLPPEILKALRKKERAKKK